MIEHLFDIGVAIVAGFFFGRAVGALIISRGLDF